MEASNQKSSSKILSQHQPKKNSCPTNILMNFFKMNKKMNVVEKSKRKIFVNHIEIKSISKIAKFLFKNCSNRVSIKQGFLLNSLFKQFNKKQKVKLSNNAKKYFNMT